MKNSRLPLLFGTMLLGATVPAEAATVVFDSEQSIVLPQAQMGRIQ